MNCSKRNVESGYRRKMLRAICLLFALLLMSSAATAQACTRWLEFYFDEGILVPPGGYNCSSPGPWTWGCTYNTNSCPPPSAAEETRCIECQRATAGAPINLSSGDTYIAQTDIRIPGLGGGLALARTWNSMWPSTQAGAINGSFGPQWRSSYEERVFVGSDNYVKYARSDGSFWSFGYVSLGTWGVAAPAKEIATLTQGSTFWTIKFHNGEQRVFDNNSGSLIAIIDRNGNTTQLSYDGANRLITVTDPASRHLYFAYQSQSTYLVTGVTSDSGHSVTYSYDGLGRLIRVVETDGTQFNFDYDSNSFIADVKDANSKILEAHTYDSSGRGLTSTRANGVEAVTVNYPVK